MAPAQRHDVGATDPGADPRPPLAGRYHLQRTLGSGASATVWLAFDTVLERRVAVKILAHGRDDQPDKLERFRREARALAQLGHPHIVTVIDTGEEAGTPFIVLEYVAGETLKARIRRAGRLPVDEAIAYAIEVARALAAAHERGIVHRDVKSQNILLDPDGGAKLTDFGIARSGEDSALTQGGRVLGTTDYVSPEQALGHEVTGQSDLYSLGIVLYEALTGTVPFAGSTQLAVASMHVRAQIPDIQRARPEVSATLAAVLDRVTAKRIERRYPDARSFTRELERALAIETARSGDATGAAIAVLRTLPQGARGRLALRLRHRGSTTVAGALAALLVVGAMAAFALTRTHRNSGPTTPARFVSERIRIGGPSITAYNPFGTSGSDNAAIAALALSTAPAAGWSTNRYARGELGKPGVGVYVRLGHALRANRLNLRTSTPGFALQVWGTSAPPPALAGGARNLGALGWHLLGANASATSDTAVALSALRPYRYYLVWITSLEPGSSPTEWVSARISGLCLWRRIRV